MFVKNIINTKIEYFFFHLYKGMVDNVTRTQECSEDAVKSVL